MRRDITLQRFITLPFLLNIVLLVPSSAPHPHIKVILPPNSTSQEVTLFLFTFLYGNGGYQFKKKNIFLIIILKLSWKINLYLKVTVDRYKNKKLLYLTLT